MKHQPFASPRPESIAFGRRRYRLGSLSVLEICLVTAVVGIALAVAIPGYVHLEQNGRNDSARVRLVDATHVLDRQRATTGTYRGAVLPAGVDVGSVTPTSYCVETTAGDQTWHASGPYGSTPEQGACPAP